MNLNRVHQGARPCTAVSFILVQYIPAALYSGLLHPRTVHPRGLVQRSPSSSYKGLLVQGLRGVPCRRMYEGLGTGTTYIPAQGTTTASAEMLRLRGRHKSVTEAVTDKPALTVGGMGGGGQQSRSDIAIKPS